MIRDAIKKNVAGEELTENESISAMHELMAGEATSAQISAFLVSLRMKGESTNEIVALAKTMKKFSNQITPKTNGPIIDIVGTGGDKIKTVNFSTISAFVVAANDLIVAKHGNRAASGKCGSADVLEKLGYKLDTSPEKVKESIENTKIGFMFAPIFHPAMKNVIGPRKEIAIRTVFNILGPLTNPASADSMVVGVAEYELLKQYKEILSKLGCKKAIIVHGEKGLDEITTVGDTHVESIGLEFPRKINSESMGLKESSSNDIKGEGIETNAKIMYQVLAGKLPNNNPIVQSVAANAGAGLLVGEKVDNIKEGIAIATETIENGKALNKLIELIKFVNGDTKVIEEFETKL